MTRTTKAKKCLSAMLAIGMVTSLVVVDRAFAAGAAAGGAAGAGGKGGVGGAAGVGGAPRPASLRDSSLVACSMSLYLAGVQS